jgi:LPXTG-motif cell wall-anchored protein
VQALLGQLGHSLPVAPATVAATVPACANPTDAATSASAAVSYLAARLLATKGVIPSSLGSGTDWTSTANAVLDLVAAQQGADAVKAAGAALATNVKAYAQTGGAYGAGPLGTLLLVAHATGVDPTAFGGVDLATALSATERTAATPAPTPTAAPTPRPSPVPRQSPTASTAAPSLPMTGAHGVLPLTALGSALLVLGAIAVAAGRRRAGDGTP